MGSGEQLAGSEDKGITGRIEGALSFAQQVVDSGALYFRGNPAVAKRLKKIATQNRSYLAHEYFNRHSQLGPHAFLGGG